MTKIQILAPKNGEKLKFWPFEMDCLGLQKRIYFKLTFFFCILGIAYNLTHRTYKPPNTWWASYANLSWISVLRLTTFYNISKIKLHTSPRYKVAFSQIKSLKSRIWFYNRLIVFIMWSLKELALQKLCIPNSTVANAKKCLFMVKKCWKYYKFSIFKGLIM